MKKSEKRLTEQTHCQNDGTTLVGDYCHTCGQSAEEPRRAVIGLVQDVFVDTLAIDGKLARTIFLLLTRPGRLARRYLDGKRVSYSPPFRLYLFASIFFFLTAFWSAGLKDVELFKEKTPADISEEADLNALDSDDAVKSEGGQLADDAEETIDSFTDKRWEDTNYNGPAWLEPYARTMFEASQRVVTDPRLFFAELRQTLPRTLLLAPVLYALVLILLYVYRRKFYAYDHFVVSLYMHAALYAYLLLALLISKLPLVGGLWFLPFLWGWFQPLMVFRQAYGSNWISAIIKWLISMTIYLAGVVIIITIGLTFSLYNS